MLTYAVLTNAQEKDTLQLQTERRAVSTRMRVDKAEGQDKEAHDKEDARESCGSDLYLRDVQLTDASTKRTYAAVR